MFCNILGRNRFVPIVDYKEVKFKCQIVKNVKFIYKIHRNSPKN